MTDEQEQGPVQLDLATLTLGEMAAIEAASGRSFDDVFRGRASRLIAALFIHESRSSGNRRSWQELSNLRLSELPSSISRSRSDGDRKTSPR